MSALYDLLAAPFVDFAFMRRALVACAALSIGCGPIGVLLVLRRMSLIGDSMSHAVLPGAAIGFVISGLSLVSMSIGGFVAGLLVALLSGVVARVTQLREDASFAAFYLISLALGVLIVSTRGSNVDLMHVLFGTILAVDDRSLILVSAIATVSIAVLAVIYRPLRGRMLRSRLPALGRRTRRALPHPVPGPGRAQSRRRLPGARHADGRRPDDAAGRGRALLVGRGVVAGGGERAHRPRLRLCRPAALVPCRPAVRPLPSSSPPA